MRPTLALVVALTLALTGCGGGPTDEEQVRDTLTEFGRATAEKDFEALCERILAPSLIGELKKIGLPCEIALGNALTEVENPRLTVGRVRVDGERASAEVRSSAAGQEPSSDIIQLVKVDDEWRISRLAGASPPAPNERSGP